MPASCISASRLTAARPSRLLTERYVSGNVSAKGTEIPKTTEARLVIKFGEDFLSVACWVQFVGTPLGGRPAGISRLQAPILRVQERMFLWEVLLSL